MTTKNEFVRKFSKDLLEGTATVFVGAGMSIPAGFVNWRKLLCDIATDLGLDIELEHDLIAVAQYEANRTRSRHSLDETIVRQFDREASLTNNHRLLARLPIDTVWTTNYDKLLEQAFSAVGRRFDVKHTVDQLRIRKPFAEVTIYKMHGDVDHATEAVLTKDDYECYENEREAFTIQLLSDLLSKRFLFLGFSFTDPNIEYTLNRLRRLLNPLRRQGLGPKEHFCILKKPTADDYETFQGSEEDRNRALEIDSNRFRHRVIDLQNYGVQSIQIDDYREVEELLRSLNRRVSTRSIMISGAAEVLDPMGDDLNDFCRTLGRALIENGYDIVTGVGKGISGPLMIGANEALNSPNSGRLGRRIRLFPFPYWIEDSAEKKSYYESNRNEMVSQAGITIVISGNKLDPTTKAIINSPGVYTEVKLARDAGQFIIPVGATGRAALKLWQDASANQSEWFPGVDVSEEFATLGATASTPDVLVEAVLAIIQKIRT